MQTAAQTMRTIDHEESAGHLVWAIDSRGHVWEVVRSAGGDYGMAPVDAAIAIDTGNRHARYLDRSETDPQDVLLDLLRRGFEVRSH